ncbi:MAG: hypothetical protein Q8S00_02220 [Deltaproteobacteria bacterium]|nr:hypothetical protein [Deltaproteobacteria bacterium]MDZ4344579.1 hypothetical protein [Candidatus Binatia bacterium]
MPNSILKSARAPTEDLGVLRCNADKLRFFFGLAVWMEFGVFLLARHGLPKNPSFSLTINKACTILNKIL